MEVGVRWPWQSGGPFSEAQLDAQISAFGDEDRRRDCDARRRLPATRLPVACGKPRAGDSYLDVSRYGRRAAWHTAQDGRCQKPAERPRFIRRSRCGILPCRTRRRQRAGLDVRFSGSPVPHPVSQSWPGTSSSRFQRTRGWWPKSKAPVR